jgi:LPS export ABC transporter permease LptG/LPS export ABC transporter permease LptF
MRIFTRYILREVASYALLGGVLFTFVVFMRDLGKVIELVVRDSASLADAARLVGCTLPPALIVTIPMGVLFGVLLGLSRLAADSEVTAMRASGMGVLSFVRVVSIFAAFALLLGLGNSIWLAPRAAAGLLQTENDLKSSQASFEVQPRVFYEDFKNYVLYVQDAQPAAGAVLWNKVFLADLSHPATPIITTAEHAIVVNGSAKTGDAQTLRLRLINGGQHQLSATNPDQYTVSTFQTTDIPLATGAQDDTHISRSDTPLLALSLQELWRRAYGPVAPTPPNSSADRPKNSQAALAAATARRIDRIELQKRFSYPCACMVLMLIGVPLGLSSKSGGKSTGFVLTILLVFLYYFVSQIGIDLAKEGKVAPFLGVWAANILFSLAGVLLLQQMALGGLALSYIGAAGTNVQTLLRRARAGRDNEPVDSRRTVADGLRRVRSLLHIRFPLILDDYVMRQYLSNFALVLGSLATLYLIFTFFELIGDIIHNRTPLVTVGLYLLNLVPYILYNMTPLCSLVAVLITFGGLSRTSELTAMKAVGVSLWRIVIPIFVIAGILAVALFAFDEFYLPTANRRQESLRATIKGKPAQTFLHPDRSWISGQMTHSGDPSRIFYYQFFDPDKNVFANLTVYEFDPKTFELERRIFATAAHWDSRIGQWVLEDGWQRSFNGDAITSYEPFTIQPFPQIHEQPAYFKKEERQSQEMSYGELARYIANLRESGFDTMRLRVQENRKLAYPLITLVMAILAIPFALSVGKRGGLAGIATAIGLAIAYWVVAGTFEAMGNVNTLPPMLAAWSPDLLFGILGGYLLLRTPT